MKSGTEISSCEFSCLLFNAQHTLALNVIIFNTSPKDCSETGVYSSIA